MYDYGLYLCVGVSKRITLSLILVETYNIARLPVQDHVSSPLIQLFTSAHFFSFLVLLKPDPRYHKEGTRLKI